MAFLHENGMWLVILVKFARSMADKLLVMSAFIMMIELKMVPAWIAAVIICH